MGKFNIALAFALNVLILFFASIFAVSCNKLEKRTIDFGDRKITIPKTPKPKHKAALAVPDRFEALKSENTNPVALQVFEAIEKYTKEYDIPKHIMFNIAFKETRYMGPLHAEYVGRLGSPAGALGPMQVMVGTASSMQKTKVSPHQLKNDVDFNVQTSAKLLKYLFDLYKDWKIVCGAYNTGRPIVNAYAIFCDGNKDYQKNWHKP